MNLGRVIMTLPDRDFDTTESAATWSALLEAGFELNFSTENGVVAECDRFIIATGWRYTFPASDDAVSAYRRMQPTPSFSDPYRTGTLRWATTAPCTFQVGILRG
jgi:hypothetical protein